VDRTDEDSERLAIDYALELTKTQFPNQQILSLFGRVRDARAVPLLVKHLDSSASDRSQLIKTLAQIGPDSIAQTLTDRYDALNPREKATVLSCLTDLGSPKALTLAQAAIDSEDNVLFNPSVRALQQ